MYRVFLERAAERDLKQLPAKVHDRVITAIQALGQQPRPSGCRKLSGTDNDWRIRIGDYRVVYEIDDESEELRVTASVTGVKRTAD